MIRSRTAVMMAATPQRTARRAPHGRVARSTRGSPRCARRGTTRAGTGRSRLREQQPRLSIRRPDHHPALGPALLGRQRRLVIHELKAKAIEEKRDRLVVVVDDQREALEVHRPDGMGPRSGPESATTSLMARRRPRYEGPRRRAGSVLIESGLSRSHRGRGPRRGRSMRVLALLALAAAVLGGVVLWRSHAGGAADRRAAARRFATAWERRDTTAMWRALTPRARAADPLSAFSASYRQADRAAG